MQINFPPADIFRGTQIYKHQNNPVYAYETTHAAIDADGAPNAYHPNDLHKNCKHDAHTGLECLANAGYPNTSWWKDVLVPDSHDVSKAFLQPSGPFQGFFVSMTKLQQPQGDQFATSTYVDATDIPYVVIPSGFNMSHYGVGMGDVGIATHLDSGLVATFIVGDYGGGSDAKLGEASIALFEKLGGQNLNPRNGAGVPPGKIQYIIFPGSRLAGAGIWPRTNADIQQQALSLASQTPGLS
jgi:hypothetical protein